MLGLYENFPQNIHKIAIFTSSVANKKLQERLIQTLHETNSKTYNLDDLADPSLPNCTAIFEIGIAETNNFNYLDKEERSKILKAIEKKPLQIMDFFCAVRYYKAEGEKRRPLRFDYYILRILFSKNLIQTQIFHERGPRYVSPTDILNFLINKVNGAFSRKVLKVLENS
ncbi:MAG: hypothetical protein ACUVUE_03160 [Candidatus Bathycorpusculaceae bacterium]